MDFSITPEQQQLYASMKRLAAEVVAPGAAQRDKDGRWDPDIWKQLAGAGVAGMPIPEELGGSGGSIVDCCLVNEALGEGGQDGGLGLSLGAHWVIPRSRSGCTARRSCSRAGCRASATAR